MPTMNIKDTRGMSAILRIWLRSSSMSFCSLCIFFMAYNRTRRPRCHDHQRQVFDNCLTNYEGLLLAGQRPLDWFGVNDLLKGR